MRDESIPWRSNPSLKYETFCRLCIEHTTEQTLVFSSTHRTDVFQRIFECSGVLLKDIPGIAQQICDVCTSQLVICERFLKQCREADQKCLDLRAKQVTEQVTSKCLVISDPLPFGRVSSSKPVDNQLEQNGTIVNQPSIENERQDDLFMVEIVDAHHEYEPDQPCEMLAPVGNGTSPKGSRICKQAAIATSEKRTPKSKQRPPKTQCQVCGKMQQNLNQHMVVHTGEKKHVCPVCRKAFSQQGNLTHHMNQHTGNTPYKCNQCDKAYTDPQSLRSHKLIHTDERKHHCEVCGDTFKYRNSLAAHLRCHNQDRRYACSECSSTFISSSGLKKHTRTHTGERPYLCTVCNKSFKTSSNLSLHNRSHTKERRFQCDLCECWFSYKNVLKTHMNIHLRDRNKLSKFAEDSRNGQ